MGMPIDSATNGINIHKYEYLYRANSESMPIDRDFLHEYAKNPQVQQAARPSMTIHLIGRRNLRQGDKFPFQVIKTSSG
jgi:hypothetical protein